MPDVEEDQQKGQPDFIAADDTPDFIPHETKGVPKETLDKLQAQNVANDIQYGPNESLPSFASKAGEAGIDLLKGGAKGVANTAQHVGHMLLGTGDPDAPDRDPTVITPQNPTQRAGYNAEQIGEWLIPSGAEEKAGLAVASKFPKLAKFAKPAAEVATTAVESGLRNKSQGGDFTTGAEGGAIGGITGKGLRAVAPSIAEGALGVGSRLKGYGKTPGVAALEETRGIRPATIERTGSEKSRQIVGEINSLAAKHPGGVSIKPGLDVIDDAIAKAKTRNNASAIEQLENVRQSLMTNATTGTPLAPIQSATGALNLKRGIRDEWVNNWNPETMSGTKAVAAKASHAIDKELDSKLGPKFSELNQRESSLVPIVKRAEATERNAGISQRISHRIAAHTGAAAGGIIGAQQGYEHGGARGAVGGGIIGIVAPEVVSSPSFRMGMARTMYSPALSRFGTGAALQLDRPSLEEEKKRANSGK